MAIQMFQTPDEDFAGALIAGLQIARQREAIKQQKIENEFTAQALQMQMDQLILGRERHQATLRQLDLDEKIGNLDMQRRQRELDANAPEQEVAESGARTASMLEGVEKSKVEREHLPETFKSESALRRAQADEATQSAERTRITNQFLPEALQAGTEQTRMQNRGMFIDQNMKLAEGLTRVTNEDFVALAKVISQSDYPRDINFWIAKLNSGYNQAEEDFNLELEKANNYKFIQSMMAGFRGEQVDKMDSPQTRALRSEVEQLNEAILKAERTQSAFLPEDPEFRQYAQDIQRWTSQKNQKLQELGQASLGGGQAPPAPAAAPGGNGDKYAVGEEYEVPMGDEIWIMKFKGGDPNDINNWERIK